MSDGSAARSRRWLFGGLFCSPVLYLGAYAALRASHVFVRYYRYDEVWPFEVERPAAVERFRHPTWRWWPARPSQDALSIAFLAPRIVEERAWAAWDDWRWRRSGAE